MSLLGGQVNLILKDLRKGDKTASERLVKATYQHLKPFAIKFAADKNDWQDILDDAYMKVFKYVDSADPDKDGFNWLCKIVQNVANDYRAASGEELPVVNEEYILQDMEEEFLKSDAVRRAVKTLPPEDRKLIYMRFWGGKTFRDIAAITGIKKSTVYKRVKASLKEIFKILEKE